MGFNPSITIVVKKDEDGVVKKIQFRQRRDGNYKYQFYTKEKEEVFCERVGNLCSSITVTGPRDVPITQDTWIDVEMTGEEEFSATVYNIVTDNVKIMWDIFINENWVNYVQCYAFVEGVGRTEIAIYDDCEEDLNNMEVIYEDEEENDE